MHPTFKSILLIICLSTIAISSKAAKDDFLIIKERVTAELMKTKVDDQGIQAILD